MEIIINRLKYTYKLNEIVRIIISKDNDLAYNYQWKYFVVKFKDKRNLIDWANRNNIKDKNYISYEFISIETDNYFSIPIIEYFLFKHQWFLIAKGLLDQGLIIDFDPKVFSLSCYKKIGSYNDEWDRYKRYDFNINTKYKEVVFNVGSQSSLISKTQKSIDEFNGINNIKIVNSQNKVKSSKEIENGFIIANGKIKEDQEISNKGIPIDYKKRYTDLINFYNNHLKENDFGDLNFISIGFESIHPKRVSFDRNKMIFKNGNTDINPITGMRNYGVYKEAPNSSDVKFIFIYENKDDANTLYKYLKNGYKGFPGLERYVGISLTLADSTKEGGYKRFQYKSKETLLDDYELFEKIELQEEEYDDLFALVIGDFNKDEPDSVYYELKAALINKGIPSQFINYKNIRKSSVFNYHLPNISIGIHAKLGGIPWRIDSKKKKDLVIGFNQVFNRDRERFLAGSVFFDNHGYLKRTFSFPEKESKDELIIELKNAVQAFINENGNIERIVIHYYKSLSGNEKEKIDKLLRENFKITVPYAVVEINDTKSKIELGFDPQYSFGMPVSGSYLRLSRKEYLLFNNNRFKEIAPVGVKDELPLKIKIHFADESGFSHIELIEQVYEFSRLIWKGLKQRSQPATCFYAKEIAKFRAHVNREIRQNRVTQETPWII